MRSAACFAAIFSLISITGCGGGDTGPALELRPVEGTITFDGKPVEGAIVTFHPGSGRPATGTTDAEGHYTLMTKEPGDGATVGANKVTVMKAAGEASSEISSADAYAVPDPNAPPKEGEIPAKYASQADSGLTAEVKADGENNFPFDLK